MNDNKITSDMIIIDVIQQFPDTMEVFSEYGINCVGCGNALHESIAEGAEIHGFNVDELIEDLNFVFEDY